MIDRLNDLVQRTSEEYKTIHVPLKGLYFSETCTFKGNIYFQETCTFKGTVLSRNRYL